MAAKKKTNNDLVKDLMPKVPHGHEAFKELSPGKVIHNGMLLGKDDINGIIVLAKTLSNDPLLVDLIKDIQNTAAKKIYYESTTLEDLSFGKGMLHALDLMTKKITNLSKMKT
jgi:hypothetical protein